MTLEKLINKLPVKSQFFKMMIGSMIAALIIALGIHGILYFLGFEINAGIPAAFAAIGAALFAVRYGK